MVDTKLVNVNRPDIKIYDDYFGVDGIVYNKYTRKPAVVITIEEAAMLAGITERTMRKWLKSPLAPRQLSWGKNDVKMMDYEVQHWLNNVINKNYPKRRWTRALDYLKKLCLINRDTLLDVLQERHNREWTDLQKRYNDFDESHVAAYRRGVRDAIDLVKKHGIETWDYVPKIGHWVWVGGCTGMISNITDDEVTVSGVYTYYMGKNRPGHRESWRFSYQLYDVVNADPRPWVPSRHLSDRNKEKEIIWDYENIPHKSYA